MTGFADLLFLFLLFLKNRDAFLKHYILFMAGFSGIILTHALWFYMMEIYKQETLLMHKMSGVFVTLLVQQPLVFLCMPVLLFICFSIVLYQMPYLVTGAVDQPVPRWYRFFNILVSVIPLFLLLPIFTQSLEYHFFTQLNFDLESSIPALLVQKFLGALKTARIYVSAIILLHLFYGFIHQRNRAGHRKAYTIGFFPVLAFLALSLADAAGWYYRFIPVEVSWQNVFYFYCSICSIFLAWKYGFARPVSFKNILTDEFIRKFNITARENEIILLLMKGQGNKQIAYDLGVQPDTIKKHIYNVFQKAGVNSRVELINLIQSY